MPGLACLMEVDMISSLTAAGDLASPQFKKKFSAENFSSEKNPLTFC